MWWKPFLLFFFEKKKEVVITVVVVTLVPICFISFHGMDATYPRKGTGGMHFVFIVLDDFENTLTPIVLL